jgi:WD40 repeat protein
VNPSSPASQILDRLLAVTEPGGWRCAPAYLRRHAIEHAAKADRIDELLTDVEFLVHADPDPLLDHLHLARTTAARHSAAVYRMSYGQHRNADPQARRFLLTVDAKRHDAHELATRLTGAAAPDEWFGWTPRWATGSGAVLVPVTDAGPASQNTSALGVYTLDGRPMAAGLREEEGVLHRWELRTGARHGVPFPACSGTRPSLACTMVDGRPIAVTGGDNGVLVWNIAAAEPEGVPLPGPGARGIVLGCPELHGRPVVIATFTDGNLKDLHWTTQVWDLATHRLLGESALPAGETAFAVLRGRLVAVVAGDRNVRIIDVLTGVSVGVLAEETVGRFDAVACVEVDGRPVAVLVGAYREPKDTEDTRMAVFELDTGQRLFPAMTDLPAIGRAVACAEVNGRPIAVTNSGDTAMQVWDLRTGQPVGGSAGLRRGAWAPSLALSIGVGVPMVVTSAYEDTVRGWELDLDRATASTGHAGVIRSMSATSAGGRPQVLTAAEDSSLRVWDLGSRRCRELVADGYGDRMRIASCAAVADRPIAVAAGGAPGGGDVVHIWDLGSGLHRGRYGPFRYEQHRSVTAVAWQGRPVAVFASTAHGQARLPIWDLLAGHRIQHLAWRAEVIYSSNRSLPVDCVVARSRLLVVAAFGDIAYVWDVAAADPVGQPVARHNGAIRAIACVTVAGRPILVTAGDDRSVRAWELDTGRARGVEMTGHTDFIYAVTCTLVGGRPAVLSGGEDGTVRQWDLETGACVAILPMPAAVRAIAVAEDGTVIVGVGSDLVVLDSSTGRET